MCVTGPSAHERTDIIQVDVDQSGMGTSKESFSYLVSILQTSILLLKFALHSRLSHPPHSASTLSCFLFAIGERPSQVCQLSANRCVLWFEECLFVGNLQTFFCAAAKRQCHSAFAASKNKYVDCWSVPLLSIQPWSSRASQHCVNEPQPTQSPIGFSALSSWKYPCKPFVFLCLWTKTFL